jgi:hypothetical protein
MDRIRIQHSEVKILPKAHQTKRMENGPEVNGVY